MSRSITIQNKCLSALDVYWVPGDGGQLIQQPNCPMVAGGDMHLSSYVSHTFEVREMPSKKTGECMGKDKTCSVSYFTVNHNQDQVIHIKPGLEIDHIDDEVRAIDEASNIMKKCEETARNTINSRSELTSDVTKDTIYGLLSCVEQSTNDNMNEASDEIRYQHKLRDDMADKWEHYTCQDERRNTTEAIDTSTWYHKGVQRNIKELHKNHAFAIHLVPDFISEEECMIMEKEFVSGIKLEDVNPVPMDEVRKKTEISRRIQALAKNFDLQVSNPSDENLSFLQTSNADETSDYSYLDLNSAAIIINCDVPEKGKGGALTFREVAVHVNPEKYSAIAFSVREKGTKYDEKLTAHRDCPILSGKKKVIRQSMQLKG